MLFRNLIIGCLLINSLISKANSPQDSGDSNNLNVIWTTPSENSFGSMPLGNGDIGMNVWVEKNGDLQF